METFLILAAAAVAVLALAVASAMSARARRPPLRTRREQDIVDTFADGDEEALIESLRPAAASPIDRAAPILDARSIEAALIEGRFIEGRVIDHAVDGEPDDREPSTDPRTGPDRATEPRGRKAR